ncbi:MAG TPA: DegV family protein [Candidatus Onthovivens sp.]|nr:DegV family protein [Candidatus Onthovivens sp.]
MNKIIIIADSTCDLPLTMREERGIESIPLHVTFKGIEKDYKDGVDIDVEGVYQNVEKTGNTPITGAVNASEFIDLFRKHIDNGDSVIYISIGSGLSCTYNNAYNASFEFPEGRVEVIDGENLSVGTGLLILKACDYRDEGLGIEEIAERIRKHVPLLSTKFCIDRLDYLAKGGRCSGMTKSLAHMLHIHPIAKMINNKLTVYKKPRGLYKKAIDEQVKELVKDLKNIDTTRVMIVNSGHMDGEDIYCKEEVKKYINEENIIEAKAGCVITSHCGPKTIGIIYLLKK